MGKLVVHQVKPQQTLGMVKVDDAYWYESDCPGVVYLPIPISHHPSQICLQDLHSLEVVQAIFLLFKDMQQNFINELTLTTNNILYLIFLFICKSVYPELFRSTTKKP